MLALFLACATVAPPEVPTPVPATLGETVTVRVPSDCPHVVVDIASERTSDVTVVCFDRNSNQTHLERRQAAPIGVALGEPRQDRLVLEFVARDDLPITAFDRPSPSP